MQNKSQEQTKKHYFRKEATQASVKSAQKKGKGSKTPARSMPPTAQKTGPKKPNRNENVIPIVVSVVAILLIIWFFAQQFINMTGKQDADEFASSSAAKSDEVFSFTPISQEESSAQSVSEAPVEASTAQPSESSEKSATADADDVTEDWAGKTLLCVDPVNVRDEAGLGNIIGGMNPGDKITVTKAKLIDGVPWVYGKTMNSEGVSVEGWVFTPSLGEPATDTTPETSTTE